MAEPTEADGGDLLIGLGNSLRGDDGVGPQLVAWADGQWPWLRVRAVHQLTPELSDDLAAARRVLFVDAWRVPPRGSARRGDPRDPGGAFLRETGAGGMPLGDPGSATAWLDSALEPGEDGRSVQTPTAPGSDLPLPALIPLQPPAWAEAALTEAGAFSHLLDPPELLAITALLHGRTPQAWQLWLPAFRCGHGEGFSSELQTLLPAGKALLAHWCDGEPREHQPSTSAAVGSPGPEAERRPGPLHA